VSERYELIDVEKGTLGPAGDKKYTVVRMQGESKVGSVA
jgi:hypothetical protein